MNSLDEDLDDSGFICKSLIPKRKAFQNINVKNPKQVKLESSSKITLKSSVNSEKKQAFHTNYKLGEPSSYFAEKLSTCPLCLKSFKSDSVYSAHMKQCAKTHKMTTQQLLQALELQKKQMEERRLLGLRSQSLPSPKKQLPKKKAENKIESYDLALGLALSKSLATSDLKTAGVQEATLEEFGFTSRTNRRKDIEKKSVLRERTSEERQRIIVEKVAVVLLDDEQRALSCEAREKSCENIQVPQLWNLGENNERQDWYVTSLKTLVLSDEATQEKTIPLPPDINSQILELNLPQKEYHESWKKMINNSIKSDLIARTKDNQDIYLHSLVLFTRCPEVLENDFESTFAKFTKSTVLIFLEYLYCGTLNSLISAEMDNFCELVSELNYKELVLVLEDLKNKLKGTIEYQTPPASSVGDNEAQKSIVKQEKLEFLEDKDLFEDNSTQEGNSDESKAENSYWSFIQNEKKMIETEMQTKSKTMTQSEEIKETEFVEEDAKPKSDSIILSSGSESQCNPLTPLPMDYEVPQFDPYDNFHMFAEEPFSPVGLNSQSLLMGDISAESLKISTPAHENQNEDSIREEKKTVGYCSTPVTVRQSCEIKSSTKGKYKKRKSDLSASRILRKSLGLKNKTPKLSKKSIAKKNKNSHKIVEELASSVMQELSKSPLFQRKNFVEITPIPNREEFKEAVTPSPNYSIMGESLLKEQLTRYGLKKNLAKSKAKKILRHIYEELHPLYNTETGKIVKMLPSTPKTGKAKKTAVKNKKTTKKATEEVLNSSKESQNMSDEAIDPTDESEFDDLNETLTQSMPSNPIDLPSAFCEYLQNNPDYHQKILLYEPIWLEELQKSLKETFKKHFKLSDIMDYLDQQCITFRSAAQAKRLQKRNQKRNQKKEGPKKRSPS